ncbi:MAG: DNA ligase D, partial [Pseudomonadota bacterium]
ADPDRIWQSNKSVAENVKRGAVRRKNPRLEIEKLQGAIKAPLPKMIAPELATLVKQPPPGDAWVHEMKLDGYRMVCRIEGGQGQIFSRNKNEWTDNFPTIARCLGRLPVDSAWIDGEVVVMQADGRTSFQALQNALSGEEQSALLYFAFDLMYVNGYDLRRVALIDRKRVLESVLAAVPDALRFSSHVQGSGERFFEQACKLKLEGMIAKRAQSTYQSARTRDWLKVKCGMRQEMVIGGYTDPAGSRSGFGALLLGVYERDGTLRYSGKVGTGFDDATLKTLHKRLLALETSAPAFSNPPRGYEAKGAHWVQPELVAEVEFTEWTNEGTLRHPSFQGLREDKHAKEVVREMPATTETAEKIEAPRAGGESKVKAPSKPTKRAAKTANKAAESVAGTATVAGIKLSNPDKVLYPEAGLTKRDLATFYENIGEWLLPHLRNRPLTLVRCPNGWDKQCFYQKHPDAKVNPLIERVTVEESNGPTLYMVANSVPAIVALLQMGALELHPFGSCTPKLHCPDRIIFDFDPDDAISWERLVEAVHLLKTLLEELGLKPFIKTTGGKGLHVVIPIRPNFGWDEIKPFTKAIAELLEQSFPDRFVSNMSKAKRRGKIFIDYLRNGEGATAVAAYSLRAREGAPVATPVGWEELAQDVRRDYFNVRNVPERLQRMTRDPWGDFFTIKQSVTRAMMKKVGVR